MEKILLCDDYQQACLRTEPKSLDLIRQRLSLENRKEALCMLLCDVVRLSKQVDLFKKSVFYGKDVVLPVGVVLEQKASEEMSGQIKLDNTVRLLYSVLGCITESGELAEMLQEQLFTTGCRNNEYWAKEFGDIGWYHSIGCDAIGYKSSDVATLNIEKLFKRYGFEFTEQKARTHNGQ